MVQLLLTVPYAVVVGPPLYLTLTIQSKEYSTTVVSLVFQIWCCIEQDTAVVALLEDGSRSGHPHPSNGLSLVDLLMDYIHLDGDIGEWTRGAFLVVFCVCSLPAGTEVEEYLEKSVFCQVTCLCACACMCAFMHVCVYVRQ